MMVYFENIPAPPSLAAPADYEHATQSDRQLTRDEDRWVKDFIDRLSGAIREMNR